jgi:hypothetical protein
MHWAYLAPIVSHGNPGRPQSIERLGSYLDDNKVDPLLGLEGHHDPKWLSHFHDKIIHNLPVYPFKPGTIKTAFEQQAILILSRR